jgi:hypothetical protein
MCILNNNTASYKRHPFTNKLHSLMIRYNTKYTCPNWRFHFPLSSASASLFPPSLLYCHKVQSTVPQFFCCCLRWPWTIQQGWKSFLKMYKPPQISRPQKGDIKRVSLLKTQILRATVQNLAFRPTWLPEFVHPCYSYSSHPNSKSHIYSSLLGSFRITSA